MVVDFSVLIGGKAGEGVKQAANLVGKLFSEMGYYIFIYDDYPSVVRGSHNYSIVRVSDKKIEATYSKADLVVAIDERSYIAHKNSVNKTGVLFYNDIFALKGKSAKVKGLPFSKVVRELGGKPIMVNAAAIGAIVKFFGVEWKIFESFLKKNFKKDTALNLKIAKKVYDLVDLKMKIKKKAKKSLPLFTGNETTGIGAVQAGLDMYFAYPMTPSTGVLHYLAKKAKDFNIEVIQVENEISVVNMALGASYAGARSMVGSSGGGFALMNETFSLAGISEIPITTVIAQRMGPATGVPTYTAQSELNYVIHTAHGEFSRVVVAPGDTEQSYYYTGLALNLAWKYQTPTFILTDKHVAESTYSFDIDKYALKEEKVKLWDKKGKYLRFKFSKDGISPLAFPPEAKVKATSYEHDEYGITVEDAESIKKMVEKRILKQKTIEKDIKKYKMVEIYGKKSDVVLVTWGSTKGVVVEVAEKLGLRVIQPIIMEPFPDLTNYLKDAKKVLVIEVNVTGQLASLLESKGYKVSKRILKYDSKPFFVEELEKLVKKEL